MLIMLGTEKFIPSYMCSSLLFRDIKNVTKFILLVPYRFSIQCYWSYTYFMSQRDYVHCLWCGIFGFSFGHLLGRKFSLEHAIFICFFAWFFLLRRLFNDFFSIFSHLTRPLLQNLCEKSTPKHSLTSKINNNVMSTIDLSGYQFYSFFSNIN